jgi:hypothetical protein
MMQEWRERDASTFMDEQPQWGRCTMRLYQSLDSHSARPGPADQFYKIGYVVESDSL